MQAAHAECGALCILHSCILGQLHVPSVHIIAWLPALRPLLHDPVRGIPMPLHLIIWQATAELKRMLFPELPMCNSSAEPTIKVVFLLVSLK